MEEDSDDNLSFVSASSDSDYFEATSNEKRHSDTKSAVVPLQQSASTSSVYSHCSFRRSRTKRPAPQPPVKLSQKSNNECDEENLKTMTTTFVKKFNEALERFPSDGLVQQQSKNVEEYASHPINLVSSEGTSLVSNTQAASDIKGRQPIKSFTNLQIKMIDDQAEPMSTVALESSSTTASYPTQSSIIHPYSAPIYSSLIPSPQSLNQGPFYVASIHDNGSPNTVYSSFPGSPSTLIQSPIGDVMGGHYVTVAPLAYVPQVSHQQFSPLNAPVTHTSRVNVGQIFNNQKPSFFNPLAHSASDPGVHGSMLTTSDFLMPQQSGPSLSRLSEVSEEDHSYEDVDHRNFEPNYGDVVPPRQQHQQRLERSDSVTVAHLYEDLLISSRWNFKVTFTNLSMVVIATALFLPNFAAHLYNFFRLVFGTLFPAYYSYKAVRTKNVKEYVKWMMYWIVFAFFTCAETITDVFFSFWFPFYYEIKILVVLWLLSPATRGSSILYRKFVHPWLTKKEEEIDECIAKAKQQGYTTVVQLGTKGVNYATSVIMQTAIKGGGGIVSQLKRSYSTSEIGEDTADHNRNVKALSQKDGHQSPSEEDSMSVSSGSLEYETRHRAESESISTRTRGHSTGRSVRSSKTKSADVSDVYFHDAPEPVVQRRSPRTHDAGRYPMQLSQEQQLGEPVLRRDKRRAITRPKSLTIGGSAASKEAWLEARRNHTTGSIYTNIPESPLESSNDCEFYTPAFSSMRRKASRSFRSSLH